MIQGVTKAWKLGRFPALEQRIAPLQLPGNHLKKRLELTVFLLKAPADYERPGSKGAAEPELFDKPCLSGAGLSVDKQQPYVPTTRA